MHMIFNFRILSCLLLLITFPSVTLEAQESIVLTEAQLARLEVEASAFDYSKRNPGCIGISVLEGPDLRELGRTASEFAGFIAAGVERKFDIESSGFYGDNGKKATEITYYYQLIDTNNSEVVVTSGPHNIVDAVDALKEVIETVKAVRKYSQ